jgi:hypothetical protein
MTYLRTTTSTTGDPQFAFIGSKREAEKLADASPYRTRIVPTPIVGQYVVVVV